MNRDAIIHSFIRKRSREADGMLILEDREFRIDKSRIDTLYHFIHSNERRTLFSSVRAYTLAELRRLLEQGGFSHVATYGTYERSEYHLLSERTIILSRKA
jgi:hypothetical protein